MTAGEEIRNEFPCVNSFSGYGVEMCIRDRQTTDRRERAKIARAGGYTAKFIEGVLNKRRKENETI